MPIDMTINLAEFVVLMPHAEFAVTAELSRPPLKWEATVPFVPRSCAGGTRCQFAVDNPNCWRTYSINAHISTSPREP